MYKIVQQQSLTGLEQEVNKLLAQGFSLVGGMMSNYGYYFQTVHKEQNVVNNVMNFVDEHRGSKVEDPLFRRRRHAA